MRKIPTLFRRDPADMKHVLPEVNPVCQWVLDGEGVATRKYDGTCVLIDPSGYAWMRREVKPGKTPPPNYAPVETDETTGKTVGLEPAYQTGFAALVDDILAHETAGPPDPGTYELCGPKVNGNPEGFLLHTLIPHGSDVLDQSAAYDDPPRDFDGLRDWLLSHDYEGIVWHHPDGRMAKLKRRDFA